MKKLIIYFILLIGLAFPTFIQAEGAFTVTDPIIVSKEDVPLTDQLWNNYWPYIISVWLILQLGFFFFALIENNRQIKGTIEYNGQELSLQKIRYPRERIIYFLSLFLGIFLFLIINYYTQGSFLLYLIIFSTVFSIGIIGYLWGNSLYLNKEQFSEIYQFAEEICHKLNMKKVPHIFVVQNPFLNAGAIRYLLGNYIILNSSVLEVEKELNNPAVLKMVLAHEIGHHWAGHLRWLYFIELPLIIPLWGSYLRRLQELTADRVGLLLSGVNNQEMRLAMQTLACGSMAKEINQEAFNGQINKVNKLWTARITQWFSDHPLLTNRIVLLEKFTGQLTKVIFK